MAELSWAGITLNQDSAEFFARRAVFAPDAEREEILDAPDEPETSMFGLTRHQSRRRRPRPLVNQFYYPCGASNWAEGRFILDDAAYQQFLLVSPGPQPFVMDDENNSFTTNLYALPPRPYSRVPDPDNAGQYLPTFWLLILVDERYYWQLQGGDTDIDADTDWSDLYVTLADQLGITLTPDDINPSYLQPSPDSALDVDGGNLAYLLDAVAFNVGQQVVRKFDGTYVTMNVDTSLDATYANYTALATSQTAGGLLYSFDDDGDPIPDASLNWILPATVDVVFPIYVVNQGPLNPRTDRVPYATTTGDTTTVSVLLSEQDYPDNITGYNGTKTFRDTCPALYTCPPDPDDPGTPNNSADLIALATQIATDYWDSLWAGEDLVYSGPVNWTPEGLHDLIYTFREERNTTRVRRLPFNLGVDYLLHWESGQGGDGAPFWAKITASGPSPGCCVSGAMSSGMAGSGGGTAYSWTESERDCGQWDNGFEGARSGTLNAYEANNLATPTGTHVLLNLQADGTYLFTLGGGGGSPGTGNSVQVVTGYQCSDGNPQANQQQLSGYVLIGGTQYPVTFTLTG